MKEETKIDRVKKAELESVDPADALRYPERESAYGDIITEFWNSELATASLNIEWVGDKDQQRREKSAVTTALRFCVKKAGHQIRIALRGNKIVLVRLEKLDEK